MILCNISIFDLILLILVIFVVVPILSYLCIKFGTVGFYRGKEANKREKVNSENTENKKQQFNKE
jgi:hypothetical protein